MGIQYIYWIQSDTDEWHDQQNVLNITRICGYLAFSLEYQAYIPADNRDQRDQNQGMLRILDTTKMSQSSGHLFRKLKQQ